MFSRFRVGDYVSLTIVGGLFFLQQPIAFCEPPPTQTLEFPDGFRGWAVIVWGQRGYPSLVSKGRDLHIRFPADGILITSTASPMKNSQVIEHHGSSTSVQTNIQGGEPFRQDSFYIDSIGRRVSPNSILRVERFEGMVGKPGLSNTLFLVGASAPASSKQFEEGRQKVAQALSRLH
jgi:hypothetical protein